ncbi:hypothetical protein [Paracoccus sp. R86501]|uniref:hypothetical protein n=1 Tax=Paracoccus sp. R86501 TaxID=3101711 RepID=UPI003671DFFB
MLNVLHRVQSVFWADSFRVWLQDDTSPGRARWAVLLFQKMLALAAKRQFDTIGNAVARGSFPKPLDELGITSELKVHRCGYEVPDSFMASCAGHQRFPYGLDEQMNSFHRYCQPPGCQRVRGYPVNTIVGRL